MPRLEHLNARYLLGYVCLHFVVYASLILDGLPFHASKDFNSDKATKQSRDLTMCLCFSLLNVNNTSKSKQTGCFVSRDS